MNIESISKNFIKTTREAKGVLLVAHKNLDGDAIGSLVALANYFSSVGKDVFCFAREGYRLVSFLDKNKNYNYTWQIVTKEMDIPSDKIDLICVLDSSTIDNTDLEDYVLDFKNKNKGRIMVIDHHRGNEMFGDINIVESEESSTSYIIYEILKKVGYNLERLTATAILLGILEDTGVFSNEATSSGAFRASSELLERGASYIDLIKDSDSESAKSEHFVVWSKILSRVVKNDKLNICYSVIPYEEVKNFSKPVGLANFFNYIPEVKMAMIFSEDEPGKIKVSLRSDGSVDASKVARFFGGGGHKRSAGFSIDGALRELDGRWRVV